MALVRKAGTGQLVETELQGAGGQPLAAPTPITPGGAAAAGASEDQAKMAGTPQQKAPVLAESVAPAQTLQTAQRAQGAQAQADPSAYQQAQDKLGTLKGYGSYADRLQGIIQSRLQGITAAAPGLQVNEAGLAQYAGDPTKQTAVKAALEAYLAAPSEAGLLTLAQAQAGPGGNVPAALEALKADGLKGLVSGAADTMAALGQGLKAITVADIAAAKPGSWTVEQLAKDLGMEGQEAVIAEWSPDQLQAAIQGKVGTELSQTDALQAELASASPQRAQQIRAELARLGVSGVSATEAEGKALADSLEAQEEVLVNGKPVNIQALLADDGVSDLIRNAVNSEAALQALKDNPTTAGLATWIETHKASLAQAMTDAEVQVTGLDAAQDDFAAAFGGLDPEAMKALGIDPTKAYTSEELAAKRAEVEASPLYRALTDPKTKASMVEALSTDPELAKQLVEAGVAAADMPGILATKAAFAKLSDDERSWMAALGVDTTKLLTDPAAAASALATYKALAADPITAKFVFSAPLTKDDRKRLRQPGVLEETMAANKLFREIEDLGSADSAVLKQLTKFTSWVPKTADLATLKDQRKRATRLMRAYVDASKTSSGATDGAAQLRELVESGIVDTTAELALLSDPKTGPATLANLYSTHQDSKLLTGLANAKTPGDMATAVARLVLGPRAQGGALMEMLANANSKRKTSQAAADFLKSVAFLDINKDGRVDRGDFYGDNRDTDPIQEMQAEAANWGLTPEAALAGKSNPFAALRNVNLLGDDGWALDDWGQRDDDEIRATNKEVARQAKADKDATTPTYVEWATVSDRPTGGSVLGATVWEKTQEQRQYFKDGHYEVTDTRTTSYAKGVNNAVENFNS